MKKVKKASKAAKKVISIQNDLIKVLDKHDRSPDFDENIVQALGELFALALVKGLSYPDRWVQPKSTVKHIRKYSAAVESMALAIHKDKIRELKLA